MTQGLTNDHVAFRGVCQLLLVERGLVLGLAFDRDGLTQSGMSELSRVERIWGCGWWRVSAFVDFSLVLAPGVFQGVQQSGYVRS